MPEFLRPGLRGWVMMSVLLALALMPLLPFSGAAFYQDLVNRLMILAIAALSLNLILGFGGMISFGHAAYLGIGAYCVGIPAYYDVYNGFIHFPLAIALAALFALVTGAICLRTKGVYFIMITMAFAQMVYFAFVSIEEYGGDDGLVINVRSKFAGVLDIGSSTGLYYLSFAALLLCLYLLQRIVNSRFGRVIEGCKDNERRMQAIGFNTYRYRLACYVISGAMCGFAGALLGNFTNFISPEMMSWTRSGELIFMVVLGGAGSLFGPVLGAAVFLLLEEFLADIIEFVCILLPDGIVATCPDFSRYWQLLFGILLILMVLFARGGIDGLLNRRNR
jgi:branched-chain amino acid transport system permease protein